MVAALAARPSAAAMSRCVFLGALLLCSAGVATGLFSTTLQCVGFVPSVMSRRPLTLPLCSGAPTQVVEPGTPGTSTLELQPWLTTYDPDVRPRRRGGSFG